MSVLDDIDLDPEDFLSSVPLKKVPYGDVFEASRAGDVDRLKYLLESGVNVNARDQWDSVALYYACLAAHLDAARMLLESGAICSEHTFDGDRCHYAALNLKVICLMEEPAPADVIFYLHGRPIEAHRVILSARLEIAVDDMEDLVRICKVLADALLPHLQMVSPSELCHWLILSDMYGVLKIREYCLDIIAYNFETFADTKEFRAMLLTLLPPSGDSSLRTTVPNAPGAEMKMTEGNVLDDLREKWLEVEAGELDKRDESALLFDKRLEMLMTVAQQEQSVADYE
ncbi:hypothetical protein L1987_49427 [Smallanthus sonchifolius]|uniref:Uncharacterized protein n=1 Tax=Smallanthus sonchifolius TaxID=185202 RepID=A0ACB9FU18_9ASTR|nr:hypothetical protein L1987_49427 [Smallanthus sonchifolius]